MAFDAHRLHSYHVKLIVPFAFCQWQPERFDSKRIYFSSPDGLRSKLVLVLVLVLVLRAADC
ncbi:hypothetical protein [Sandarakinorhabdus sp.]|uniref:hypothetical protein n=1 Tax=Sandarakinorhabdus sp. TaxID=1916663 RepID=UPI003F6FE968